MASRSSHTDDDVEAAVAARAQFGDAINAGIWRRATGAPVAAHAAPAIAHAGRDGGAPLPDALRARFEAALGADLSAVRVHPGPDSAHAADAVAARAYAIGQDIHFADGNFDPTSPAGEHLLAHEVVHTVQQRARPAAPQFQLAVSQPGDALEAEADAGADALVAGRSFAVAGSAPAAIHRVPRPTTAVNNGMINRELPVTLRPGGRVTLHTGTYVEVVSRTGAQLHVRVFSGYHGAQTDIPADAFRAEPEITDAPSATRDEPDERVMYRAFTGPLWGSGGPVLSDIDQGSIGDCYLLAALGAIVTANPARIQSMITPHTPNLPSYQVTVYEFGPPDLSGRSRLAPVTRAIDTNFPVAARSHRATTRLAYAGDEAATHAGTGGAAATGPALWPLLIEKAMSYTRGGYQNLDNDQHQRRGRTREAQSTNDAFERLLGERADTNHDRDLARDAEGMLLPGGSPESNARFVNEYANPLSLPNGTLVQQLARYLAAHRAVELGTPDHPVTTATPGEVRRDPSDPTLANLFISHEYVLQRVDVAAGRIFVYNPHGPAHQLPRGLTEDEVRRYFTEINVSGAVADHR